MVDTTVDPTIDTVLRTGDVRSVYQPIVDLDGGSVIAFEALSRGPEGTPFEQPEPLFAAAREADRVHELDALCMDLAVRRAEALLPSWVPLFINVEPTSLSSGLVERTAPIAAAGERPITLEVTERAITRAPGTLLEGLHTAREHGWRIALDDVGVDEGSLAFLPIIRPDVVKLDMGLIRNRPDRDLGRTMAAVMAYAERTGAVVLAEGIETDEHLERARSLGATVGQGYRFGRPGPLPQDVAELRPDPALAHDARVSVTPRRIAASPFDAVVRAGHTPRTARKSVLLQISHHLEDQALADPNAPLLLSAFQNVRHFTPATAHRYRELASHSALCAALGTGMTTEPVTHVRGASLMPGDALEAEWSVVVLGPHYCGALLGRDLGDTDRPESDRRFDYVVTHDRAHVELAAESLLRRVLTV